MELRFPGLAGPPAADHRQAQSRTLYLFGYDSRKICRDGSGGNRFTVGSGGFAAALSGRKTSFHDELCAACPVPDRSGNRSAHGRTRAGRTEPLFPVFEGSFGLSHYGYDISRKRRIQDPFLGHRPFQTECENRREKHVRSGFRGTIP